MYNSCIANFEYMQIHCNNFLTYLQNNAIISFLNTLYIQSRKNRRKGVNMTSLTLEKIFETIDCGKKKGEITKKEAKNAKAVFGGIFLVEKGMNFEQFKTKNQEIFNSFAGSGSVVNEQELMCTYEKVQPKEQPKIVKFKLPTNPTWFEFVKRNDTLLTKVIENNGIQGSFSVIDKVHILKLAISLNNNEGKYSKEEYNKVLSSYVAEFPLEISEEFLKSAILMLKDAQSNGSFLNNKEISPNR